MHVRTGRLRAFRGPHGAYYVDAEDLESYPRPRRGWPAPDEFSDAELEQSWDARGRRPTQGAGVARSRARSSGWLRADPDRNRRLYRLVSVHRLQRLGLTFSQIADELGITPRHARRLSGASVFLALRRELVRRYRARAQAEGLDARNEAKDSVGGRAWLRQEPSEPANSTYYAS